MRVAGNSVRVAPGRAPLGDELGEAFEPGVEETPGLRSLRPRAIWAFLKKQPPSYWLILVYLLFEYVRPQNIYEAFTGPPYVRVVVILALTAFVLERRKIRFGTPELLLSFFTVVVLTSSLGAFHPSDSFGRLDVYLSWVVIYVLLANGVDTEERFIVFMLCYLIYNFKMSQFGTRSWAESGFAFREWGATGAPGFFRNSGEFGIQMCIFLPLIVAFIQALGQYWRPWMRWIAWGVAATAVTGIVGSSSRGAILGAGAVGVWAVLKTRRKVRAFVALLVVAGLVYAIVPPEQKARLQAMGDDPTSVSRTTFWKHGLEMMQDHPILGIGYSNWSRYHAANYGTPTLPHNIFIEAGAELGYTGLVAFIALLVSAFVVNRDTRRLAKRRADGGRFLYFMAHGLDGAMVGFVASGFFVTVLYYPYFWINLAMTVALNHAARQYVTPAMVPWRAVANRRAQAT